MRWVFPRSRSVVCPSCGSVYISRRKGLTEFFLHTLIFTTPYGCMECALRFFRFFLIHSSHHDSANIGLLIWYRSTVSWKNSGAVHCLLSSQHLTSSSQN